jgi:hypothetical protein
VKRELGLALHAQLVLVGRLDGAQAHVASSRSNCSGVSLPTTLTASSGSSTLRNW